MVTSKRATSEAEIHPWKKQRNFPSSLNTLIGLTLICQLPKWRSRCSGLTDLGRPKNPHGAMGISDMPLLRIQWQWWQQRKIPSALYSKANKTVLDILIDKIS
ncbi:coiled-coil domain-containing protein 126 isoform X2 [Vicugna pacos]|uniref:Coiled-coil domain-containing protein 126 isoform X2 n=1 Tax=Vicugna pacos TaxID=30538 RepID=A0ABM5DJ56_VICPA